MYGMDCSLCTGGDCINCKKLDKSHKKMLELLRKTRKITGVKNVFIRSGIRYDITTPEYVREVVQHHLFDTMRIAPEHVNRRVLQLMNKCSESDSGKGSGKNSGSLAEFIDEFNKIKKELKSDKNLSFYFMTAHPGSTMKEAEELSGVIKKLKHAETVQIFTPTPMTVSTCVYYTGIEPKTKKKVYVPYTYREKKEQKRAVMENKGLEKQPRQSKQPKQSKQKDDNYCE